MRIAIAFVVVALLATGRARGEEAARPNLLVIFSDDHAEQAVSAYGSRVNVTPHLDRLAAAGARFTNSFVTNAICTPSRATLLTGQGEYRDPKFLVPGHTLSMRGHATEVITDLGIEFLNTRPAGKPFFLMLHHKAPHRNWQPDDRNAAKFSGAEFAEPATLRDDYPTRPAALPVTSRPRISSRSLPRASWATNSCSGSIAASCRTTWPACRKSMTRWAGCSTPSTLPASRRTRW